MKHIKSFESHSSLKNEFISYLEKCGNDAQPFSISDKTVILSFAGSDGPDITDKGIETEMGLLKFSDTKKIDKYIKMGCKYNCNASTNPGYPTKTWEEYYNEIH